MNQLYRYHPIALKELSPFIFITLLLLFPGCERNVTGPPTANRAEQTAKWVDVDKAVSERSPIRLYSSSIAVTTTIEFDMIGQGIATLTVNDGQDVIVANLIDHQELISGSYETTFDASRLASGVYLYELEIKYRNAQRQLLPPVRIIRKMLLIK